MKRKIFLRAVHGAPLGIALGTIISILISAVWGGGYYAPCVPELVQELGSELGAMILQTALCALLGAMFGGASVVWEIESWSIVKQTGVYFLVASLSMMPIAYFTRWMEHSIAGCLSYFGIFVVIFAVIWLIQYIRGRRDVRKMNEKLSNR